MITRTSRRTRWVLVPVLVAVTAMVLTSFPVSSPAQAASGPRPISLTLDPTPVDANGYTTRKAQVTVTANCGTVPASGYRKVTRLEDLGGGFKENVIYARVGSGSGDIVINETFNQGSRLRALGYRVDCNFGPSGPPQSVTRVLSISDSYLRTTVVHPNGNPVSGLSVTAHNVDTGMVTELTELGNLDGVYEASVLAGNHLLTYRWDTGEFLAVRSASVPDYDTWVYVDVTLGYTEPGSLSGMVTWADGSPVAHQQVQISGTTAIGDIFSTKVVATDDHGAYELDELPAGDYQVRVMHNVYGFVAHEAISVGVDEHRILDIVLDTAQPGFVQGRATFSDGSPVVSDGTGTGNVTLTGTSGTFDAHTDGNGWFRFDHVDFGEYELQVEGTYMPGYVYTSDPAAIDVIPGGTTEQDVVLAMPTGRVNGGVLSSVDSSGIPGVVVSVPSQGLDTVTDDDGMFTIEGIEGAGSLFDIEVHTSDGTLLGTLPWMLVVPGESSFTYVFVDEPDSFGAVEGTVAWSNGAPVTDAQVRLVPDAGGSSLSAAVDLDGAYALTGAAAGDHRLEVVVDGDVVQTRNVTVSGGETLTEDFVLVLTGSIIGEARWDDLSGPVDGVAVQITDGSVVLDEVTGADGLFAFDDLTPGLWNLQATHDGDVVFSGPLSIADGEKLLVVLDVPVPVVVPDPDLGAITGQVRWDDLSGPVDGVAVQITDGSVVLDEVTGADGLFGFDDLTPGIWQLTATHDGEVVASRDLDVPEGETVEIVIDVAVPDPGDDDGEVDDPGDGGTDPGDGGTGPGDDGTDPGDDGTDPGDGGTGPGQKPGVIIGGDDPVPPGDDDPVGPGDEPGVIIGEDDPVGPGDDGPVGPGDDRVDDTSPTGPDTPVQVAAAEAGGTGATADGTGADEAAAGSGELARTGPDGDLPALVVAGQLLAVLGLAAVLVSRRNRTRHRH